MYRFYSKPNNGARVSVVGQVQDNQLKIAVARCSEKDQFVRKVGRELAEGRLNAGLLYSKIPMEECTVKTFVDVAQEVVKKVLIRKKTVLVSETSVTA